MYDTRLSATHPTGAATQCYIVIHFIAITLNSFLQYIQKTTVSNGKYYVHVHTMLMHNLLTQSLQIFYIGRYTTSLIDILNFSQSIF